MIEELPIQNDDGFQSITKRESEVRQLLIITNTISVVIVSRMSGDFFSNEGPLPLSYHPPSTPLPFVRPQLPNILISVVKLALL